jgi:hypothetical protein
LDAKHVAELSHLRRLKFSDEVIQRALWARIPPARFCKFGFKMLIHGSSLFGVLLAYFSAPLIMNTLAFAGVILHVTGYVLSNLSLCLFGGATACLTNFAPLIAPGLTNVVDFGWRRGRLPCFD